MSDCGDCLFGIDFGTRRIGLAIADTLIGHARPLACIDNRNGTPDWDALDMLVREWQPSGFVLGWPLADDGTAQPITGHARGFEKRLRQRYPTLPVHRIAEGYTSNAAQREIAAMRASGQRTRRTGKADVDTLAAALILQDWLDAPRP